MLKLDYLAKGGSNHLTFGSWEEYWKTLGYLSNPNANRYYVPNADIKIVYENNDRTNSRTGAYRIEYFGDENWFSQEFPALYRVARPKGNMYRINRNEFGQTLVQELGFTVRDVGGANTDIVLPPTNIQLVLNTLRQHPRFNENSWNEGYNLGNL